MNIYENAKDQGAGVPVDITVDVGVGVTVPNASYQGQKNVLANLANRTADVADKEMPKSPTMNVHSPLKRKIDCVVNSSPLVSPLCPPVLIEDAITNIAYFFQNPKDLQSLSCTSRQMNHLCNMVKIVFTNLSLMSWTKDSFFSFTKEFGKNILTIDFTSFSNFFLKPASQTECETILSRCPNVKALTLTNVTMTDGLANEIGKKGLLESLILDQVYMISAEKVGKFVTNLKNLSFISFVIDSTFSMASEAVDVLASLSQCPTIRKIEMHRVNLKGAANSIPLRKEDVEPVSLHLNLSEFDVETKQVLQKEYALTLGHPSAPRKIRGHVNNVPNDHLRRRLF